MESQFDNDLARALDPEAAQTMEDNSYDIKFFGPLDPAFRSRKTGVWSKNLWVGGTPVGTILALDYETLVQRIGTFKRYQSEDRLQEWREGVYLPQRAAIVFEKKLHVNDKDILAAYCSTD